jgi:UDP-N-acetylglucosamine transferase subunit ALG13
LLYLFIGWSLIISHGGTGALGAALKLGKKVVAVPRLVKYQEHIDGHQIQVFNKLEEQQYLKSFTRCRNYTAQ